MTRLDNNKKVTKEPKLRSPLDVVFEKIKQTWICPPERLTGKILNDLLTSDNASSSHSSQEYLDELVKDKIHDCADLEGSAVVSEYGIKENGFSKETKKLQNFNSLKMPKLENPWAHRMPVKKTPGSLYGNEKVSQRRREREKRKERKLGN
ncbi:uncharacterized protein LOC112494365 [Cephus cinctus]|uniref:Uncharacterized protein LOC112494365 n=1 Tax=Cephus cinctus TaxID=211228 RepID=A0AAJ7RIA3_CEPCN|nr:uncharacterized protein LOC112494365 [Cephus cinctus]